MTEATEQDQARDMIKAVYDDGVATINGRDYTFTKMVHKQRRKVFAFMTKIGEMMNRGDMSFLDWPEFEQVEQVINGAVLFNGSALSRLDTHWDHYPEDYVPFISTAMGVISYPFLSASHTG